jgi:hypothetical protein
MNTEIYRLALGFLILIFHQPIADYLLEHERSLVVIFRQRGIPLPAAPTTETCRNIYFSLGAFVIFSQLIRIWLLLRG